MRKRLPHILVALAVTGASVLGVAGTAHADSPGGCRFDYASVGLGYSLKPCVEYAAAAHHLSVVVAVRELPHSTDVDVCGQLIPVTTGSKGPVHCALMPRDENVEIDRNVDQGNDPCTVESPAVDYVYDSWIVDDGNRIGDVQSPRITCY